MKIREVIKWAEMGMTKEEILEKLGIDDKEYKVQMSKFSKSNKETLKRLLIKNKRSQKSIGNMSGDNKVKAEKEIYKIYDTSYILSSYCDLESIDGAYILPKVYEQLTLHEMKGNKKLCKLFHYILERKIKVNFVKKVEVTETVPYYEDPADFELIAFAKQVEGAVIYTADKGLALRCMQQGIEYKFLAKRIKNNEIEEKVKTSLDNEIPNIILKRDGKICCNRLDVVVRDKKLNIKKPNKLGLIWLEDNDILLYQGKTFSVKDNRLKAI